MEKIKVFNLCFILFLLSTLIAKAQPGVWRYLNSESGGFVSTVLPVKYPTGQQPSDISKQFLYARTDVGGIWSSGDNGKTWGNVTCYFCENGPAPNYKEYISRSETHIQGIAVRNYFIDPNNHSDQKNIILVAWGNDENDAYNSQINGTGTRYQSIWRSANNGGTFTWAQSPVESPGVWFQGNNTLIKMGGECIVYDPNNISGNLSHAYMGGTPPPGASCKLFKSINDGISWNHSSAQTQNFPGEENESIICIAMKEGLPGHIWVGTTKKIAFTTNGGVEWFTRTITGVANPYVKRMIIENHPTNGITVYATWGNFTQTGICKFNSLTNNYQYQDLTPDFGSTGSGPFSSLAFVDDAESIIIAGQYSNDLKTSSDRGNSWSSAIHFKYTSGYLPDNENYHNYPNHQGAFEIHPEGYMTYGLGNIVRNPNPGWGGQWYIGGGGGRKTAPAHWSQWFKFQ